MIKDFNTDTWNGNNIIIYGAGDDGKKIAQGLLKMNIGEFYFCDEVSAGGKLLGQKIISPKDIMLDRFANLLIGTGKYCDEVYHFFQTLQIEDDRIFTAVELSRVGCSEQGLGANDYEGGIKKFFAMLNREVYLPSLDLVITECCTLKCRHCSNLMQYYKKPVNSEATTVLKSFQNLLDIVGFIGSVRILGGEPFVNQPLLIDILKMYKNESKIGKFVVVTNGTIIPNKECLIAMQQNNKVEVVFSNYGNDSLQLPESIRLLKSKKIHHVIIQDNDEWLDYGRLKHYEHTVDEFQQLYRECSSRRYCNTLFKGSFYLCPRAAHGINLGAIPQNQADGVNLLDDAFDIETNKKKLMKLMQQDEYIKACEFCNWKGSESVPKAIQTPNALDYEKCGIE